MKASQVGLVMVLIGGVVSQVEGFALLGYPSDVAVQAGSFKQWDLDQAEPPSLTLSYSVEADFLSSVPGAREAATNAFTSWDGLNTALHFTEAGYDPSSDLPVH